MSASQDRRVLMAPEMRDAIMVALVLMGRRRPTACVALEALAARYDRAEREDVLRAREDADAQELARRVEAEWYREVREARRST